jgi:hypothetical protein
MRCDKCKREMSDDEPAWRLWRSLTLCADCKPDAYFREPQPCTRCGRPVHDHDTTLGSSTAARAVRSCYFRPPEPCARRGQDRLRSLRRPGESYATPFSGS